MEDRTSTLFLHFAACHPAAALPSLPIRKLEDIKDLNDGAPTSCRFTPGLMSNVSSLCFNNTPLHWEGVVPLALHINPEECHVNIVFIRKVLSDFIKCGPCNAFPSRHYSNKCIDFSCAPIKSQCKEVKDDITQISFHFSSLIFFEKQRVIDLKKCLCSCSEDKWIEWRSISLQLHSKYKYCTCQTV